MTQFDSYCPECKYLKDDEGNCSEGCVSFHTQEWDAVERPAHYNHTKIECIDVIRDTLGPEGFSSYCHGNMIKYTHRHKYKDKPLEDLKKASWYLNKMIEELETYNDK